MSNDWVADMKEMHDKYNVREWMENNKGDDEIMKKYLRFRLKMLNEELNETIDAALFEQDADEVVDGIIDLIVFAIGTLDVMEVDAYKAWDAVLDANMAKEVGVKPGRDNPLNLPDLIKPAGWKAPTHEGNHGLIEEILK